MSSELGQALGLTTESTWSDVTTAITSVASNESVTKILSAGESYTITAGYHDGSSVITAPTGSTIVVTTSGSFTSGSSGSTSKIDIGITNVYAVTMRVSGTTGFAFWSKGTGSAGLRGSNTNCSLIVSGSTMTYTATNSNWASRTWTWWAVGYN